jgi:hypothetical protein
MKYTGTIVKEPIIQDKKITTAIKINNASNPIQMITFPEYRDAELINTVKAFKINDEVIIYGKEELNRTTRERQIIINKAYFADAKQAIKSMDEAPAPADISPTRQVEDKPLEVKKYTFPDGKFFWSDGINAWREGHKDKAAKLTYDFVDKYNRMVTSDKWLKPDWFILESIERMKNDPVQIKLMEEFATY